jgi:hypothetical protein
VWKQKHQLMVYGKKHKLRLLISQLNYELVNNPTTRSHSRKYDIFLSLIQNRIRYGVKAVRIARVLRTEDESGVLSNIETDIEFEASNTGRRLIIELDPKQYVEDGAEFYEGFNLIVKIDDLWRIEHSDTHQ